MLQDRVAEPRVVRVVQRGKHEPRGGGGKLRLARQRNVRVGRHAAQHASGVASVAVEVGDPLFPRLDVDNLPEL